MSSTSNSVSLVVSCKKRKEVSTARAFTDDCLYDPDEKESHPSSKTPRSWYSQDATNATHKQHLSEEDKARIKNAIKNLRVMVDPCEETPINIHGKVVQWCVTPCTVRGPRGLDTGESPLIDDLIDDVQTAMSKWGDFDQWDETFHRCLSRREGSIVQWRYLFTEIAKFFDHAPQPDVHLSMQFLLNMMFQHDQSLEGVEWLTGYLLHLHFVHQPAVQDWSDWPLKTIFRYPAGRVGMIPGVKMMFNGLSFNLLSLDNGGVYKRLHHIGDRRIETPEISEKKKQAYLALKMLVYANGNTRFKIALALEPVFGYGAILDSTTLASFFIVDLICAYACQKVSMPRRFLSQRCDRLPDLQAKLGHIGYDWMNFDSSDSDEPRDSSESSDSD